MAEGERPARLALGEMIERRLEHIVGLWLTCVRDELGEDEMATSELRDAIPDYLTALAALLQRGEDPRTEGGGEWARVARGHAVTRIRQDFDVSGVLSEFIILRRVIAEVARQEELDGALHANLVAESIEAAIAEAVRNYVDFRDQEARRTEAQHVAFVTHELRNPLGTATLGITQLRELSSLDDDTERLVAIVERAHEKLRTLIDEVLTVEQGRAGEITPEPEAVTLGAIVDEAVGAKREAAERRGFEVQVDCDDALHLSVDRRLTVSAVQNLVENAIKYSERGPVEVWSETEGDIVSIHVKDQCGGMSQEELSSLFAPFRRGKHRGRGSGTGLGLSIVRQAVEAQDGTVHAEPTDGGCHFWITLPIEVPERSE